MPIQVTPSGGPCGALLTGIDLRKPLSDTLFAELRALWLVHQVIAFTDQAMSIEDLERFSAGFGPRSEDPFIAPIAGHPHVIEVRREADEKTPLFAQAWHSDWSFLPVPPAGTALYGTVVPPVGGDTLFANQYAAWDALPQAMQTRLEGLMAVHSARRGYSREGLYGDQDQGRSMTIRPSDDAQKTRLHPVVRAHPETGRKALFINPGYTIAIDGLPGAESRDLLKFLLAHQVEERFVYRHRWTPGMLTLWDNRCVLHAATGGYDGHRRLMHRVTIGERQPLAATAQ